MFNLLKCSCLHGIESEHLQGVYVHGQASSKGGCWFRDPPVSFRNLPLPKRYCPSLTFGTFTCPFICTGMIGPLKALQSPHRDVLKNGRDTTGPLTPYMLRLTWSVKWFGCANKGLEEHQTAVVSQSHTDKWEG